MRRISPSRIEWLDRKVWIWLAVWVSTRALIVAEVGFWATPHPRFEDVSNYEAWSHFLTAHHAFPEGQAWQYPPGAGLLMLLPRLVPAGYGEAFVGLMLLVDLAGLVLLARLGRRSGNDIGVWGCRCSAPSRCCASTSRRP